jgi:hypothetical protein
MRPTSRGWRASNQGVCSWVLSDSNRRPAGCKPSRSERTHLRLSRALWRERDKLICCGNPASRTLCRPDRPNAPRRLCLPSRTFLTPVSISPPSIACIARYSIQSSRQRYCGTHPLWRSIQSRPSGLACHQGGDLRVNELPGPVQRSTSARSSLVRRIESLETTHQIKH